MAQANPFDQFDEAGAPQTGVTVNRGRDPRQAAADRREQIRFEERNKPTLPTGFQWIDPSDPSKGAQPIPGTKDKKEAELSPEQKARIDGIGVDNLVAAVRKAREAIGSGWGTGWRGAVGGLAPQSQSGKLDAAIDTLKGNVMLEKLTELKQASPTGASGLGALSESEGRMLASVITSLSKGQPDADLLDSLDRIERHALSLKAIRDGKNPTEPEVAKAYGITVPAENRDALAGANGGGQGGNGGQPPAPQGPSPNAGDSYAFAQGGYRDEQDPARVGVNARVRSMLGAYKSPAEIVQYLNSVSPGLGDSQAGTIAAAAQFRQRNPNVPMSEYPISLELRRVPMSSAEQTLNKAAQSPLGAGVVGAADSVTLGLLDNATDNPALTRAAMAGLQQQNPGSYLAGQIGGQALLGFGVEGGLGRLGANRVTTALASDALPGMAYGAGSADEGDRATGALTGGLAGILGGVVGRGTGRAISGVSDANVGYLANAGVRMTPGEILGGEIGRIENALTSFPGLGGMIRRQRLNSLEDWNRAAFREGDPSVTDIGQKGLSQLIDAEKAAYGRALNGVQFGPDAQFGQDFSGAVQRGMATAGSLAPDFGTIVGTNVNDIVGNGPTITGEQFQDVLRLLRNRESGYNRMAATGTNPMGEQVANSLADVEGSFMDLAARQAPGVVQALDEANQLHARKEAIKAALPNTDAQLMTPLGLAAASARARTKFGGSNAAKTGDRPFNDLTNAGQAVLPSSVPDSGTALRNIVAGGGLAGVFGGGAGLAGGDEKNRFDTGSAGNGLAAAAGLAGLLSLPYLGRGAIQNFLTRARPAGLRRAGEVVGALPGSIAVPLLVSPEG